MAHGKIENRTENIFERWDRESCVRSKENKYQISQTDIDASATKNWFPPDMLPFLKHPAIKSMPNTSIKYLQAHYLVYFLDYTTSLEHTIVNRALENIIHGKTNLTFSKSARNAGMKIYTDEGYHAQFSAELAEQVASHFSFPRVASVRIKQLRKLLNDTGQRQYHLVLFLVVFVSETIIASELLDLASNQLIDPVHQVFRDHLHDEARHAQYFCDCFVSVWNHLNPDDRRLAALCIPKILDIFCRFDESWLSISLATCPSPPNHTKQIISECRVLARSRKAATSSNTLEAIKRTDLLDNPSFRKIFIAHGLIYDD